LVIVQAADSNARVKKSIMTGRRNICFGSDQPYRPENKDEQHSQQHIDVLCDLGIILENLEGQPLGVR